MNIDGLQSGPKRIVLKEKSAATLSGKATKGNYMKPTEAYR